MIPIHRLEVDDDSFPISLGQSWRTEPEPGFLAGRARVDWTDTHLVFFADLEDADVFNDAVVDNMRTWETGDVFEIFWRTDGENGYREVHVTPDNARLHLAFPADDTITALRSGEIELDGFFQPTDDIESSTVVKDGGWMAVAQIPRANAIGDVLRISLCRYDAHRDRPPTVSSSSPHPVEDFHRPQDWLAFELV